MTESGRFRPEFLARIKEIIPFDPITEEMAEMIFSIQLKSLINSLTRMNMELSISKEAIKHLATNGFSSKYGARQISGVIRTQIARPISKMIVREEVKAGQTIGLDLNKKNLELKWKITDTKK